MKRHGDTESSGDEDEQGGWLSVIWIMFTIKILNIGTSMSETQFRLLLVFKI